MLEDEQGQDERRCGQPSQHLQLLSIIPPGNLGPAVNLPVPLLFQLWAAQQAV